MRKTTVFAVMIMSLALVSCSKSGVSTTSTPAPTSATTPAITSTPIITTRPAVTATPVITTRPAVTATPIDRSAEDYKLTEYDRGRIQCYLQRLDSGDITEEDLSEVYAEYGTAKVNEVREEMNKEREAERKKAKEEAKKAREEAKKKAERQALAQREGIISKSCDKSLNKSLLTYVNKVPSNILDSLQSMGYHIELVQDPGKECGLRNICGLTVPEQKRILIQAREYKFRRSIVHEIGHAYDDYLGWVSCSDKFINIYKAEKNDLKVTGFITDGHYKDNELEYFAEAFQMYVFDKSTLKDTAPKTYRFVKQYMK